jgi:iron complex transport system ATP-binding protein
VLVLHDLNHACRYSHHLIAMRRGAIVTEGRPSEVVTRELVREVFALACQIVPDPVCGTPMVIPIGRHLGVDMPAGDELAPPPAGPPTPTAGGTP